MRWILLFLLASCTSTGVEVTSFTAKGAAFGHTYTWRAREDTGDSRIDQIFVDEQVRRAVDEELRRRGFAIARDGHPGFSAGYHTVLQHKRDRDEKTGYGGDDASVWDDSYRPRNTRPREVERGYYLGRLVLEFQHAKSGEVLWRGSGAVEVNPQAGRETRRIKVRELVRKILDEFPG